ncbi:hypothetical protein [Streptomyces sp. NBC_00775]|uniref:hypothetical protein n=1 Tax=unclassified Streptomyces TaxID=2593676 RepID=UPI003FA6B81E
MPVEVAGLFGDQRLEEASGFDHGLPHFLGTALVAGRCVHAAVAVDMGGVVDGEGGDLLLELLAVGEAAVPCQARQQRVRLGDGLLWRVDELFLNVGPLSVFSVASPG